MVVCPVEILDIRNMFFFFSSQKIVLFPQCSSKGNLHTGFDRLRYTFVHDWVGISGLENEIEASSSKTLTRLFLQFN